MADFMWVLYLAVGFAIACLLASCSENPGPLGIIGFVFTVFFWPVALVVLMTAFVLGLTVVCLIFIPALIVDWWKIRRRRQAERSQP